MYGPVSKSEVERAPANIDTLLLCFWMSGASGATTLRELRQLSDATVYAATAPVPAAPDLPGPSLLSDQRRISQTSMKEADRTVYERGQPISRVDVGQQSSRCGAGSFGFLKIYFIADKSSVSWSLMLLLLL